MQYGNKKVRQKVDPARQTAQIIANVFELERKNLIKLTDNIIYLYPQLWKDKKTAINWIYCLHQYYMVKRQLKSTDPLYFNHIETGELMGKIINKKAICFNM